MVASRAPHESLRLDCSQALLQIGTPKADYVYALAAEPDGTALYVGGCTDGSWDEVASPNKGSFDVWLAKYAIEETGFHRIWVIQFGSPSYGA